jgi:predicted metal-binding protein
LPLKRDGSADLKEFLRIARDAGATAARILPAHKVIIDERVRLKCEVPRCSGFGRYLTCPPHVMPLEVFSKILGRYKWCLLVQVEARGLDSTDKGAGRIDSQVLKQNTDLHRPFKLRLLEVVEAVEAAAFKRGLRFATGLVGGSCALCEQCVEDLTAEVCRHPFRARPPMEGVGIDVAQTAESAGLPIHLSSSKNVLWTGLVLLE